LRFGATFAKKSIDGGSGDKKSNANLLDFGAGMIKKGHINEWYMRIFSTFIICLKKFRML